MSRRIVAFRLSPVVLALAVMMPATGAFGSPAAPVAPPPTPPTTAAATTTTTVTTTTGPATTTGIDHGQVQILELPSGDADGASREVWVYRPAVPDSASLPVVYFLHGYPGNDRDVEKIGLPALLDEQFAAGATPFVVAVPNGRSAIHPDTEWADSVDGDVRLESFVVDTVVPAVEGDNRRDRDHRAIAGFSMGGYGSMNLALRHPDLFGQVVSIAGYYHIDDPDGMGAGTARWAEANSPDRHVAAAVGTRMLLIADAGEKDGLIKGEAARFAGLVEAAGLQATLVTAPGGHNWAMVAGQVPAIVEFLDAGW